jgi:hypothetical protein
MKRSESELAAYRAAGHLTAPAAGMEAAIRAVERWHEAPRFDAPPVVPVT